MGIWAWIKEKYEKVNWLKFVMSIFTIVMLFSYTIDTLQNIEAAALDKLTYFYKWAISAFAILHEYQRWTAAGEEDKNGITVVQGETYVMLFMLTTIILLFVNVVWAERYPVLPKSLNQLIELTIWVAGAFGLSRISKSCNESKKKDELSQKLNGKMMMFGKLLKTGMDPTKIEEVLKPDKPE